MSESSADLLIIQAKGTGAPGLDDAFALTNDDIEDSIYIEAIGIIISIIESIIIIGIIFYYKKLKIKKDYKKSNDSKETR